MTTAIFGRVLETSATTGTGALSLAAAITGYRRFADVCSIGTVVPYCVQAVDGNGNPSGEWETGLGTYSGANTLTRTTPRESSNGGAAVNFGAGTKHVFLDATAPFLNEMRKVAVSILVTDPNGAALTTGDGKAFFRVPSTIDGFNLVGVAASVSTTSSSGNPTIQIHNVTQTADMLSTRITIDAGELDSKDAAPAVIDTSNDDVATGDKLRIDVDVAGTGAKGLIVELQFAAP